MRAYDSWKLVQIQRGRATVTGFSANRKSDLGVVYLFLTLGRALPGRYSYDRHRPRSWLTAGAASLQLSSLVCIGELAPHRVTRRPLAA